MVTMTLKTPPDDDAMVFDAREPGLFRRIYMVIAILVVISLILGMGGYAVWQWIF